tara:strand:+ start:177 stop:314 length:138 start_codon:yes stop_codon:yes gene_type:complete
LKIVAELAEALKLAPELIEDFYSWLDHQLEMEAQYKLDILREKLT